MNPVPEFDDERTQPSIATLEACFDQAAADLEASLDRLADALARLDPKGGDHAAR